MYKSSGKKMLIIVIRRGDVGVGLLICENQNPWVRKDFRSYNFPIDVSIFTLTDVSTDITASRTPYETTNYKTNRKIKIFTPFSSLSLFTLPWTNIQLIHGSNIHVNNFHIIFFMKTLHVFTKGGTFRIIIKGLNYVMLQISGI